LSGLQKRDSVAANAILDKALEHPTLAKWFPILQANVVIDERAVGRRHRAVELGKAPITSFYNLAYGRASNNIPGAQFRDLVLAIARKPNGGPVGLEIVSMRLHSDRTEKREPLQELREAGRALLAAYEFHSKDNRTTCEDHELGVLVKASLAGPEGVSVARRLCRKLMDAAAERDVWAHDHDDLVKGLLQVHPVPVLDELFSGDEKSRAQSVHLFQNLLRFHKMVPDVVPAETILSWCDVDPVVRCTLAAAIVTLFKRPKDGEPHEWTPITRSSCRKRLTRARCSAKSSAVSIHQIGAARVRPSSRSGSSC
jgi:hypothetical protein